jgi:hypothetical protein
MQQQNNQVMHTPFELFGMECASGWNHLIKPLFEYIEQYNQDKEDDKKIVVTQVKEKFGGLRFYTNFATQELHDMISKAEEESYETCEFCGTKENVGHTSGWITTCCRKCLEEKAKQRGISYKWKFNSDTMIVSPDGTTLMEET